MACIYQKRIHKWPDDSAMIAKTLILSESRKWRPEAGHSSWLRLQLLESILQMINGKSSSTSTSKPSIAQDEHAKRLKEVKDNLDDQMNSKVGGSNVHLDPQGTSIYVRNYEQQ